MRLGPCDEIQPHDATRRPFLLALDREHAGGDVNLGTAARRLQRLSIQHDSNKPTFLEKGRHKSDPLTSPSLKRITCWTILFSSSYGPYPPFVRRSAALPIPSLPILVDLSFALCGCPQMYIYIYTCKCPLQEWLLVQPFHWFLAEFPKSPSSQAIALQHARRGMRVATEARFHRFEGLGASCFNQSCGLLAKLP